MKKKRKPLALENIGSLITYKDEDGKDCCLGYLWMPEGRGAYDPDHGLIEGLAKDEVDIHNKCLDEAMLKGLDESCEIGQGGMFYLQEKPKPRVVTFIGTLVSDQCKIDGTTLRFIRHGKRFVARIRKDADLIWCKRTA